MKNYDPLRILSVNAVDRKKRLAGRFLAMLAAVLSLATVCPAQFHSADTGVVTGSPDHHISLVELTRVIELYQTRYGTTRTGAYKVQAGTEDGFGIDATRDGHTELSAYHSADMNHDGNIDYNELGRVIQFYNYRAGTVRTGEYHALAGTEDGFAAGPPGTRSLQTLTFAALPGKSATDAPFLLTATSSSGLTVSYRVLSGPAVVNGNSLTLTGPGTVTVQAFQDGNAEYLPAVGLERSFDVTGVDGGTLGADRSIWRDLNGDGQPEEIIRANTSRFQALLSFVNPDPLSPDVDLNTYWKWGDLKDGATLYQGFRWFWLPPPSQQQFPDAASIVYEFDAQPGYDYIIFPELNNFYGNNVANWPVSQIFTQLPRHSASMVSRQTVVGASQSLSSLLNSTFYLIRVGNGDANNDGLPNAWQTLYFGSPGAVAAAPNADPDGDGLTNLQEFLLGRNPTKGAVADTTGAVSLRIYSPTR